MNSYSINKLNLCIITPQVNAYSETFIREHIKRLPANTRYLYGGGDFPVYQDNGTPIMALSLFEKAKRVLRKKIYGLSESQLKSEALIRFFQKNNIQAVLAEYGPTGAAVCESCDKANVPLIVHFHGYDAYEYGALKRFKDGYQRMFKSAAAIVAVSNDMTKQLIELGAPADKIHLNSCGVDVNMFNGANPTEAPATFVAVGRFADKKAPYFTILAFEKVLKKYPDAKLIMIGEGELLETCKQLSLFMGINSSVDFLGKCTNERIVEAMKGARAFVQHSIRTTLGDSEGTPVAVLEASASGLPVIATRHAGIKDVVVDGKTGLLCDERDVESMSQHMLKICQDAILAGQMGNAARIRIKEEYSMEIKIDKLYEIISTSVSDAQPKNINNTAKVELKIVCD